MLNLKSILTLIFISTTSLLFSQKKTPNLQRFSKLNVKYNTVNNFTTIDSLNVNSQYLLITENINTSLGTMENCAGNTKSFGKIEIYNAYFIKASQDEIEREVLMFDWYYSNSYDDEKGTARVKLIKACNETGTFFRMTVILENLDVIFYEGEHDANFEPTEDSKKT